MSKPHGESKRDNGNGDARAELDEQMQYWNSYINDGYRPAADFLELDEIKISFWGIASNSDRQPYEDR